MEYSMTGVAPDVLEKTALAQQYMTSTSIGG